MCRTQTGGEDRGWQVVYTRAVWTAAWKQVSAFRRRREQRPLHLKEALGAIAGGWVYTQWVTSLCYIDSKVLIWPIYIVWMVKFENTGPIPHFWACGSTKYLLLQEGNIKKCGVLVFLGLLVKPQTSQITICNYYIMRTYQFIWLCWKKALSNFFPLTS